MGIDAGQQLLVVVLVAILLGTVLVTGWMVVAVVRLWLRAVLHGTPVSMLQIVAMRLRGSPAPLIIDAYIMLKHRGVDVRCTDIERASLEDGNRLVSAADLAERVRKMAARPR